MTPQEGPQLCPELCRTGRVPGQPPRPGQRPRPPASVMASLALRDCFFPRCPCLIWKSGPGSGGSARPYKELCLWSEFHWTSPRSQADPIASQDPPRPLQPEDSTKQEEQDGHLHKYQEQVVGPVRGTKGQSQSWRPSIPPAPHSLCPNAVEPSPCSPWNSGLRP